MDGEFDYHQLKEILRLQWPPSVNKITIRQYDVRAAIPPSPIYELGPQELDYAAIWSRNSCNFSSLPVTIIVGQI
jgi:hypothetical protein